MASEKSYAGWYFLIVVIVLYFIAWFLSPGVLMPSLNFAWKIILNIIPIFVLIFAIMALFNYFISPAVLSRYVGKSSGIKRWIIAIVSGIVSTGPIYMWYPLLKDLKGKGVSYGFIATFLYNRAVKIPMIPLLIFYFSLEYIIILTVVMIVFSIIQGIIFERFEKSGFL